MKTKTLVVVLTAYVVVPDEYEPPTRITQELKAVPAKLFVPYKIDDLELTYETRCAGPVVQ